MWMIRQAKGLTLFPDCVQALTGWVVPGFNATIFVCQKLLVDFILLLKIVCVKKNYKKTILFNSRGESAA